MNTRHNPLPRSTNGRSKCWSILAFAVCVLLSPQFSYAEPSKKERFVEPLQVLTIVAPEFPEGVPVPADGVRVELNGMVQLNGELKVETIEAVNADQSFSDAVRSVVNWWRFVPDVDWTKCEPRTGRARVVVWFEGTEDDPQISISYPETSKQISRPRPPRYRFVGEKLRYPKRLLGIEGLVQMLLQLEPDGRINSAKVLASTGYGVFDKAVLSWMQLARVEWLDEGITDSQCVRLDLQFCTEGTHENNGLPFEPCRSSE